MAADSGGAAARGGGDGGSEAAAVGGDGDGGVHGHPSSGRSGFQRDDHRGVAAAFFISLV